jgi:hypothetical protein
MFLYDCIGVTISNVTNKIIEILYKCNYFINNSQIIKCLDKEYIYEKYCNITIETCNCIQNTILYNNSIYTINYNLMFVYVFIALILILCCCKKKRFIIINNSNSNISLLEENDTTSNILNTDTIDNNYYVINKNDTLPKYNEIDSNTTQITIVENSPPKYNEMD